MPNNVLFSVQKEQTYYLKTSDFFASQISLKLSAKSIKERSGSSKKKAVKLQSGKKAEGVAELGNKAGGWYKFTLNKKKVVQVTVKGCANGGMRATLYLSSDKKFILLGVAVWPVHASAATLNGGSVSKITVKKIVTGNEDISKFPEYTISYTKADVVYAALYDGTRKFYGIVVPVELSEKSVFYLDFIERTSVIIV